MKRLLCYSDDKVCFVKCLTNRIVKSQWIHINNYKCAVFNQGLLRFSYVSEASFKALKEDCEIFSINSFNKDKVLQDYPEKFI